MDDSEQHRILLIDYDDDLITRLKVLLADEGYDVTAAWGGRDAQGLLGSKKFDVILLGDHLPDTNGRELWRLLRKVPSDAEVALIQGSDPATQDVRSLFRDYADHCVLTRSTPAQIASAVVRCLRRQTTSDSPRGGLNGDEFDSKS